MAAMALLGQRLGRARIARAPVNPKVPGPVPASRRASARSTGANVLIPVLITISFWHPLPRIPAAISWTSISNVEADRLLLPGIFDEGRIMAVAQRRPDQRIELCRQSACEPFGLNAVGVKREMKSVLLRRRANRQYRGCAVLDPPRDLVPTHAFDEMALGIAFPFVGASILRADGNARQKSCRDPSVQIARAAACRAVGVVISRQHLAEHAERNAVHGLVPHHRFLRL